MRVLFVTPEIYPMVKTGGLGDISAALPPALRSLGADVRLLLPGHPAIKAALYGTTVVRTLHGLPGAGSADLLYGFTPDGVPAFVLDAPGLFDRPGNPYVGPDGHDWPDNHLRFAAFGWAAAWFGTPDAERLWRPDILHGHDWQTGLMPAYSALWGGHRPGTVMTIHNLAYQGNFPSWAFGHLHLPPEAWSLHGVEYYDQVGFLKAGLFYADRLTTVSPTYAREIQGPEQGYGMQGLLATRAHDLVGILNGVDDHVWNPATDPHLPHSYDADRLDAKAANKEALQRDFGLEIRPDAPLFAVVSRLTHQKGLDLVFDALSALVGWGGQLVVLGTGERWLEDGFRAMAASHPRAVGVQIGYDEGLSHRMQGGADVILVPSRSEPCGLTQLYGLRYGTLPLVRRAGGLADSVIDTNDHTLAEGIATGFVFDDATAGALIATLDRAIALYREPWRWRQVQRTAMTRDFGWRASAEKYLELFRGLRP